MEKIEAMINSTKNKNLHKKWKDENASCFSGGQYFLSPNNVSAGYRFNS